MTGFDSRTNYVLGHSPGKLVHRKSFLHGSYFKSRRPYKNKKQTTRAFRDDGIFARGDLSRQTVHRTVWSFGQIANAISSLFQIPSPFQKQKADHEGLLFVFGADDGI